MRTGRTILALFVALSLAMLPIAGAFAVPQNESTASTQTVASAHDCCDDDGSPADRAANECQAAAGCFAKCFNFCAVLTPNMTIHLPTNGMVSIFVATSFPSPLGSPPFRPPRV